MPNRLINETSPYLLQHANNPVDWYAWGPEALEKARSENKPIFLSIGYAACHWCHVMEHESFEDPETADLLNQHFVSIKVDREERPDLDSIYMNAVVAMTGQGGWPMSVFLTPEGEPFYGGTYFPPTRRYGMPAFKELLTAVANAWTNDHEEVRKSGQNMAQQLAKSEEIGSAASGLLRPATLEQAARGLLSSYDWRQGGWGKAPRFPQPMAIEFLLMQSTRSEANLKDEALQAAVHALRAMSRGGMYDVVGGGFHRYSVDDEWLVPHFEKMLYDNAQLALAYLHAYLLTGELAFRQVCEDTLDFLTREMTDPQGGFTSSLDADSEGEEGKYYVWTPEEIEQALPETTERTLFQKVYPVTAEGNFEGKNILQRQSALGELAREMGLVESDLMAQLAALHQRLNRFRGQRVRPGTDDKVLVSWNALALRAFAEAARYLHRQDYLEIARKNADFLLTELYPGERLLRAWRKGKAQHNAYLEDYAGLILGLLALYQSDPNLRWYQAAVKLAEDMNANFRDKEVGFFDTRADHETLIMRPKEIQDNATPSGNGLAANALLHLSAYDERDDWRARAEGMLSAVQDMLTRYPTSFGMWLQACDFAVGPVRQIALVGPAQSAEVQELLDHVWHTYRPRTVVALADGAPTPQSPALLHDRIMMKGQPTVYICQNFTCNFPVNTLVDLKRQLD